MHATRVDEADVRDEDGYPGQQPEDGNEVDKVAEDDGGAVRDVEEGEEAEGGGEGQCRDGDTTCVGTLEDGRGVADRGEAEERSRGDVEI